MKPLPLSFFRRSAEVVARDLIGATIVSTLGGTSVSGLIVETEAYLGYDDPASHAYRGRRHAGNLSLYSPAGTWYVYRSYGIHWCANLVVAGPMAGAAVLLRAVRPLRGLEVARDRRGGIADRALADGPGKLCQALGISRELDGTPMRRSAVIVAAGVEVPVDGVLVTPRIGISKAREWPLRYVVSGQRGVSPPTGVPIANG